MATDNVAFESSHSTTLPPILRNASSTPRLIAQGAEALLYKTNFLLPTLSCALKYRPSKPYRHPTLDARLTRHRILAEARTLVKCRREGVKVPAVYALDADAGWLGLEWVEGIVVKEVIREWYRSKAATDDGDESVQELLKRMGEAVGTLHRVGIVHGDLTTSNMMLQSPRTASVSEEAYTTNTNLEGEIVLIDFGLASQSSLDEDRAVDLYVLERAFGSTHPGAEKIFGRVLEAYGRSYKGAHVVLRRLEDVRMRGRKRSMVG